MLQDVRFLSSEYRSLTRFRKGQTALQDRQNEHALCLLDGTKSAREITVNETKLPQGLFDPQAERTWTAVAAGFLLNNDRGTALTKLVNILQLHIHDGRVDQPDVDQPPDYDAIARLLIQAAGTPSLFKQRAQEEALAA
jgi:hypothetical protein